MVEKFLDLSTCKTSDDVRAAAEAFYQETQTVPEEPARPALYRPAVIQSRGEGRLWFEVVHDRDAYRDNEADFMLRSYKLEGKERLDKEELLAFQEELRKAIEAYDIMSDYAERRKAWKKAVSDQKEGQRTFIDTTLKTWAESQKKK